MSVKIDTLIVGLMEVNCHVVWNEQTKQGVIIDPGDEAERIAKTLNSIGVKPLAIMLTHGHGDHIAAVTALRRDQLKIPVMCGRGDEGMLVDPMKNLSALVGTPVSTTAPERILEDEELLALGGLEFRVLATPGHSPGGVCFLMEREGAIFCGDTLFYGSIGRTDFPGCSTDQLLSSIKRKIMTLPDRVVCYPGHGPSTTVGAERVNNPFLTGAYFA